MNIDISKTQTENAKLLNISGYLVQKYCDKHSISLPKGRGKKPNVIINPFTKGTEESYYWLGYFLGDGIFSKDIIGICSKDKSIIQEFHSYCNNSNKINQSNYYVKEELFYIYKSYFGNKKIRDELLQLGFTLGNKAFNANLDIYFPSSFIRGLFDSDGSFSKREFKITSSNKWLIDKLVTYFSSLNYKTHVSRKDSSYDFYVRWTNGSSNKEEALENRTRLYNWLYTENCMCLERKRLQFAASLSN